MPYCITLRSRADATVTGWYAGRNCRWSTVVSARYGSITQAMPVPFAKNCAACARGTPASST
jgi:hypothetical protein